MSPALSPSEPADAPIFADGLGERLLVAGEGGEMLQALRLHSTLAATPGFELALRERALRLAAFRHPAWGRVRRLDRVADGTLALVSEHVEGIRLSEILRDAEARGLRFDPGAAMSLLVQLTAAVGSLHGTARDAAHGLIAPERLVVTPDARLVIVEHVLGSAIERLQFGRERFWSELRVAVPASAGAARLDQRADVTAIGATALALLLGRPLRSGDFPHAVSALLVEACGSPAPGAGGALPPGIRGWLARALQLEVRRAFGSAVEALAALQAVVAAESCAPSVAALEALVARLGERPRARRATASVVRMLQPRGGDDARPRAIPQPVPKGCPEPALLPAGLPGPGQRPAAAPDGTAAAAVERTPEEQPLPAGRAGRSLALGGRRRGFVLGAIAAAAALLLVGAFSYGYLPRGTGTLIVHTTPPGVPLFVDGVPRGATPAALAVAAGPHILELRGGGVPRVIPFTMRAGAQISQHLEFTDVPRTGTLVVDSQPTGATVLLDGVIRGTAPLTIEEVSPGEREVVLRHDSGVSRHAVTVLSGATVTLVVPAASAPAGPVSGWISLDAPFTVEVHENGRLLGTSDADRLMLAAGRHVLELRNETLGLRQTRAVQVQAGKITPVPLELPTGLVNLNASPWAEVWIDGRRAGETPLGNLELPIGPHEIVFRHPELGERRHAVSVTMAAPVRLSVAMQ